MKLQRFTPWAAAVALMSVVSGCYNYPPPPSSALSSSYTQRQKDKADEIFSGMKELSLAEAKRMALVNNPTYAAAYQAISVARMRYYQALGAYSPTVTSGVDVGQNNTWNDHTNNRVTPISNRTETFGTNTNIQANLLVFDGLSREFQVMITDRGIDYQALLHADEARTLVRAVSYAYNTVLLAIEKKRIAIEDMDFQLKSLQDTEHKYQAGVLPLSDVLNFRINANAAASNKLQADYQYEIALYALGALIGYPEVALPSDILFPEDFKKESEELMGVDVYLDTALANRPDLKAYRKQLEIARYQVYQTYSSYSPTINAYAQYNIATSNTNNVGAYRSHGYTPSFGYGLQADWTIFNGFIRYNTMRQYQANMAIVDYQVFQKWLDVVQDVRNSYANYIQSVKQTKLYEKTRDLSQQQRDLVAEEYRAGTAEITRLNQAQRDLVSAETDLASSYINVQNAKAQLDAAIGIANEEVTTDQGQNPNNITLPNNAPDAPIGNPADGSAPAAPATPAAPAATPAATQPKQ